MTGDVQLIMMGSGEGRYADFLMRAEAQNKVSAQNPDTQAHTVYAENASGARHPISSISTFHEELEILKNF